MKTHGLALTALILFACAAIAQSGTQKPPDTYTGEIFDTQCALQASHEAMENTRRLPNDAQQCVIFCVKNGARLVLYDPGTGITYAVDDQEKLRPFAGQQVKITGTLDTFANILHLQSIDKQK